MKHNKSKSSLIELIKEKCVDIVQSKGFELADVEFEKEEQWGDSLVIYIHSPEGVNIEDCVGISKIVEPIIDAIDPYDESYSIIVSSLGIDRAFKILRDYERYLDKEIDVKFYKSMDFSEFKIDEESNDLPDKSEDDIKKNKKARNKKTTNTKEISGKLINVTEDKIKLISSDGKYSIPIELIAIARPKLILTD